MPRKSYVLNLDVVSLKRLFRTTYKNYDQDRKKALAEFDKLIANQNTNGENGAAANNIMWAGIPAQYLRIALDCNGKLADLVKMMSTFIEKYGDKDVDAINKPIINNGVLTEDQKKKVISLLDKRKSDEEEDDEFEFEDDDEEEEEEVI